MTASLAKDLGVALRMAVWDARDRTRRAVFLPMLLGSVALAWLAVPDVEGRWTVLDIGGFRGRYDSAYVGTVTALASGLWLALIGLLLVRSSVARDASTGVGEVLASTPLRRSTYLLAKFAANASVLGLMLGAVAVSAVILQYLRSESTSLHLPALLMPYLVIAAPLIMVSAGVAVLFDATPGLRSSAGGLVWFMLAVPFAIASSSAQAPLGGIGTAAVAKSFGEALAAAGAHGAALEVSLGLTYLDQPLTPVQWSGWTPTAGFVASRVALVLVGIVSAIGPALWFDRFDPARRASRHAGGAKPQPDKLERSQSASSAWRRLPQTSSVPRSFPWGLALGELRVMSRDLRWWWWSVLALLNAAAFTLSSEGIGGVVLAAFLLPVVIWARLGSRATAAGVEALLNAYPRPVVRGLAEFGAGALLTAAAVGGPLLNAALAADWASVRAWVAASVWIAAVARLAGTLSRSERLFLGCYPPLWYLAANGVEAVDFLGVVDSEGGVAPGTVGLVASAAVVCAGIADAGPSRPGRRLARQLRKLQGPIR